MHMREPGACASHRKSGYARQRLRSTFRGPTRGTDGGPNSFVDNDACHADDEEQGANEGNKNSAYRTFENWVHCQHSSLLSVQNGQSLP